MSDKKSDLTKNLIIGGVIFAGVAGSLFLYNYQRKINLVNKKIRQQDEDLARLDKETKAFIENNDLNFSKNLEGYKSIRDRCTKIFNDNESLKITLDKLYFEAAEYKDKDKEFYEQAMQDISKSKTKRFNNLMQLKKAVIDSENAEKHVINKFGEKGQTWYEGLEKKSIDMKLMIEEEERLIRLEEEKNNKSNSRFGVFILILFILILSLLFLMYSS